MKYYIEESIPKLYILYMCMYVPGTLEFMFFML